MLIAKTELERAICVSSGDHIIVNNLEYRVAFATLVRGLEMEIEIVPANDYTIARGFSQTIIVSKYDLLERVIKD